MVSPEQKRRAVDHILSVGMCSLRRACRYLGLNRSSYFYRPRKRSEVQRELIAQILSISVQYPTYGYRFVTALLKRSGWNSEALAQSSLRVMKQAVTAACF